MDFRKVDDVCNPFVGFWNMIKTWICSICAYCTSSISVPAKYDNSRYVPRAEKEQDVKVPDLGKAINRWCITKSSTWYTWAPTENRSFQNKILDMSSRRTEKERDVKVPDQTRIWFFRASERGKITPRVLGKLRKTRLDRFFTNWENWWYS